MPIGAAGKIVEEYVDQGVLGYLAETDHKFLMSSWKSSAESLVPERSRRRIGPDGLASLA
jgi:hypothetical protein